MALSRTALGRQIQGYQEILEQVLDEAQLFMQLVVRIDQMYRRAIFAREADAVLDRHDLIAPTMYDGRGTVEQPLAQRWQAFHVERRGHKKGAARVQQRGCRDRNIAAETRADQH